MAVLVQKMNAGEKVGDAFIAARFSPFECHLVAAGERSARLEAVFQHLGEFWGRQLEMRQDLIGQLYYPVAMLHLALVVAALMELVAGSWADVEVRLIELLCRSLWNRSGRFYSEARLKQNAMARRFLFRVPIIGRTLSTACAYRWITALKIEYSAGIPMSNAVADAWRASGFGGERATALEGEEALREGVELSKLVQRWSRLPRDWVDFIETGEISGSLEKALTNLESEAARLTSIAQKRMTEWTRR